MANRATEIEVLAILEVGTTVTADDIAPFLRASNLVVTDLLASEYEDAMLAEIERWLAAHFYSIKDPMMVEERMGDGTTKYHGKSGMGLDFTAYGQQVRILDHKGILTEVTGQKRTSSIEVLG